MGITGNLETMQLSELLQWLSQSKKTGTLVVDDGDVEKRIFFDQGRIVSSASTDPREYLGQFLMSHGHITEEELNGAIRMQEKTGMLLGKILVSIGAVQEQEVHRLLQLKAEEAIYDIFAWPEGDFEFLDGELPQREMVPISLDVTGIVLEGARRVDEWNRIRSAVPSMDAVPVAVVDDPAADESLPEGDRRVLEAVDDRSTVEEIRERTHSTDFFACRVLFDAVQAKTVKVIPSPWKGRQPGSREPGRTAGEATGGGSGGDGGTAAGQAPAPAEITGAVLLETGQGYLEEGDYDRALRHLRAAQALEPFSRKIKEAVEEARERIRGALEESGVKPGAVPKLTKSMEELTTSSLSRNEGFLLTRINGSYDIANIVKISSLPELDALLAFRSLKEAGHIELG